MQTNKKQPPRASLLAPTLIAVGLALVVAIVGVAGAIHILPLLGSGSSAGNSVTTTESYESPYDFANLSFDESGRPHYMANGAQESQLGVDVSDHQGSIDWSAVANDGVNFAYVRLGYRGTTEGGLYVDEMYEANVAGAQAAGLQAGVYFYSQAISAEEAREEAALVLEQLGGRNLELPVVFDYESLESESRTSATSYETATEIASAFCEAVEAGGYKTMLYGNYYDLVRYNFRNISGTTVKGLYAQGQEPKRAIWFAEYGANTPSAEFDFAIWQYTNSGTVSGIDTAVDMNIMLRFA